ncbi:MAG: hypothetical protein KGO50_12970 [Myxococcales bacterium]|nr:hypothetical protein [Myxococcales bacterium]
MRVSVSVVLLSLLACAGCGSDNDPAGTLTPDEFPAAVTSAICGRVNDCCDWEELGEPTIASYEDCEAALFAVFNDEVRMMAIEASVQAGRVTWDGALADRCTSDLRALSCDATPGNTLSGCENVLVPNTDDGEPCVNDFDCRSGLCALASADAENPVCANTRPGDPCLLSCSNVGEERSCYETCSYDQECLPTSDGDSTRLICVERESIAQAQPCGEAECTEDSFCNDELVCEPRRENGRPCVGDFDCASSTCEEGICVAATACNNVF